MSTVCLAMIVKNEAEIIERCLESALPFIDSFCIIDTGSDDDTQEIILDFFEKHQVDGALVESEWVDFGTNRTELIKRAQEEGCADYLLLLDADHQVSCDDHDKLKELTSDAYYIRIAGPFEWKMPYLVRAALPWHYVGSTHEFLACDADTEPYAELHGFGLFHHGDGGNRENKFVQDLAFLEAAYQRDPKDARTCFYLAETYKNTQQAERAIQLYRERVEIGGWVEEVYYSLLQIALISDDLDAFYDAWAYRPDRWEAPYYIVKHLNGRENYNGAYVVARDQIVKTASSDMLFVERWMEDWGLAFEYAIAAWWVGKKDIARSWFLRLVQNENISSEHRLAVIHNLKFCEE